jgi:hypothetical protein
VRVCLRRIVSKVVCVAYQDQARSLLWLLQIGVGQPLGAEVGFQTARRWCERHAGDPIAVFLIVDFSNAFNAADHRAFLEQVRRKMPGLVPWVEWRYSRPSVLRLGDREVASEIGVRRGNNLGPLLFAVAIRPVLCELASARRPGSLQLVFSYLDDCFLAGAVQAVADAFAQLASAASAIGLELSHGEKFELISVAGPAAQVDATLFPSYVTFNNGCFKLLGGPVGAPEFCNRRTRKRIEEAKALLEAVEELPDPQVAFLLLRRCASFGTLVCSARVVPFNEHTEALHRYDEAVRQCFEGLSCLLLAQEQRGEAELPSKQRGLGLRSVEDHSTAAYLASRSSCRAMCQQLDPNHVREVSAPDSAAALAVAKINSNLSLEGDFLRDAPEPLQQRTLSTALKTASLKPFSDPSCADLPRRAHLSLIGASTAGSSQSCAEPCCSVGFVAKCSTVNTSAPCAAMW